MAKTKEELDALKVKFNELRNELKELSPEELEEVSGGAIILTSGKDEHKVGSWGDGSWGDHGYFRD